MTGESGSQQGFERRSVRFDRDENLLVNGHQLHRLSPRSSAILAALADRFGKPVSKEELLAAGWPGQIVADNSLAKAISQLRHALAGGGIEIESSYGQGYRLREVVGEAEGIDAGAVALAPPATGARRGPRWPALAAAAIVGALLFAILSGRDGERESVARTSPLLTNDPHGASATLLWVDDHPANNEREVAELRARKVAVHLATSTDDALKLLAMNDYALVVSDLGRGDDRLAGLKMIAAMKEAGTVRPVIIYTVRPSTASGQAAQRAMVDEAGASGLAVTPTEIRDEIDALLERGKR